jgi:hypothetical protein
VSHLVNLIEKNVFVFENMKHFLETLTNIAYIRFGLSRSH